MDNGKNLGKYLHKAKPKPVDTKIVPNKKTQPSVPSNPARTVRG